MKRNFWMFRCDVQNRAEEKVKRRGLLFQVKDAAPKIMLEQSRIDVLPIELKRFGVESDAEKPVENPGSNEDARYDRQKTSLALQRSGSSSQERTHSPLYGRAQLFMVSTPQRTADSRYP